MSFLGRGPFQVCSFLKLSLSLSALEYFLELSLDLYSYSYIIVYIKFPDSNHCMISASWLELPDTYSIDSIDSGIWYLDPLIPDTLIPFPILVNFIYLCILTKWITTMVFKSQNYIKRLTQKSHSPAPIIHSILFPFPHPLNHSISLVYAFSISFELLNRSMYSFLFHFSQQGIAFYWYSFTLCFFHLTIYPSKHTVTVHRNIYHSLFFLQLQSTPLSRCTIVYSATF